MSKSVNTELSPTQSHLVSRRKFMKFAVAATASLVMKNSSGGRPEIPYLDKEKVTGESVEKDKPSPLKSLYEEYMQFCEHTDIEIDNMDPSLSPFLSISEYVNNSGNEENPQIKEFIEGWGISKEEAVSLAMQKLSTITISPGSDLSEDWVRNHYLGKIAKVFPSLIIALPDYVAVAFPPVTTNEAVQTGLINQEGESIWDWSDFIHELTHIGDLYYERFKSVMDLDGYLEYKRLNLHFTGEILAELYNKESLEDAIAYTKNIPKWGESITARLFYGEYSEKLLIYIYEVETLLGLEVSTETTDVDRYTRIIWELGRIQKQNKDNPLFKKESCQAIRRLSLYDIMHSLIPTYGEDLTGEYPNNLIGERMKELARYKLQLFGNIETINGIEPEEQLRNLLGITNQ